MFDNVKLISTYSSSQMSEQMFKAREGDVVVAISFPRYSRSTVKAVQYVKEKGATIITLTDSVLSPLASLADHILTARSDMISFADSLVAPLSVINALVVAIGMRKKEDTYNTFNKLEEIWDENQEYEMFEEDETK
jgi:DNA-binding MurR/RpiR family transcriptional regulator